MKFKITICRMNWLSKGQALRFCLINFCVFGYLIWHFSTPIQADAIHLSQSFEHGAAGEFEQALNEEIDTVLLSVSGGYLAEGLAIGRIIRAHHLHAIVPKGAACLSACAEAFLGGISHQIDGVVAFHLPRLEQPNSTRNAFEQGLAGGALTAIYRYEMGFGFDLTHAINRWTSVDRLLAFRNADELLSYQSPESGPRLPLFYQN